jgi:hypothetical protein
MPDLELELRALAGDLAVPAGDRLPAVVRDRVAALPVPSGGRRWTRFLIGGGPLRRAAIVAIALILVLVTVAGAAVLGLPGLRIIFGPAGSASPESPVTSPSSSAGIRSPTPPAELDAGLGLGDPIALDAIAGVVPFEVRLPSDARLGRPEIARWDPTLGGGQLSLLWRATPDLPETTAEGVGALLTETPGGTDEELILKSIRPNGTAEPVTVDGAPGFWLTGPPHGFIWWRAVDGQYVEDSRRTVGDTLVWSVGGMLYRLEIELGRDAAIEIAESIP